MSRTRGASGSFDYSGDGEMLGKGGVPIISGQPQRVVLDRQGNPISPAAYTMAAPRALSGSTVLHGPGAEPVPDPGKIVGYKADRTTFSKNMEAYDLVQLLELMLGALSIRITPEVYATLNGNLRQHFMAVRQMDEPPEEEAADELADPPRRVGWPKGKPRGPRLPPFPVATSDE
jgi:hypothetical protein